MRVLIRVEHAYKSYGHVNAVNDISFTVKEGEFFAIIGPNGSGKSTLMHLISGVDKLTSGSITLRDQPVQNYSRKALAKWLAVLQQQSLPHIRFSVRDVIEMGRYPYQNWLGDEAVDTTPLIDDIMTRLNLHPLSHRMLDQLSGGERQRVALGKVMAQQPQLLLLDEPTTYLDIGYQVQMMEHIRQWQAESQLTVVAVLHDLNLASQYCDRAMLLNEGKVVITGKPEQVLTEQVISEVYDTESIILPHPHSQRPQVLLSGLRKR